MACSSFLCLAWGLLFAFQDTDAGGGSLAAAPQDAGNRGAVTVEEVVVIGRRGAARLPPEIELGAEEIDNLGAYDIGEAIARIGEGLGFTTAPVIIVNGRRVVDARNFMGFPPDAMVRVEVLPQQAAAAYGEDPARPVVNIVLQPSFVSRDGYLKASRPTAGGTTSLEADARQAGIDGDETRQFGVRLSRITALRAEARPSYLDRRPDSRGVTLRPASDEAQTNASMTFPLNDWAGSLSAGARATRDRFTSLVAGQVVDTQRIARSADLSGGVAGDFQGWSTRLQLQGQASRGVQTGVSDLRSHTLSTRTELSLSRSLTDLPAGPLLTTLSGQYTRTRSVSRHESGEARRSTQALDFRSALTIPVSRRSDATGSGWGDLSLSLGGSVTGLHDEAGRGDGLNANLSWSPVPTLRLNLLLNRATTSPPVQMRFDPTYYGPPRPVFDFQAGESVDVLPLLGGNPDLRPQQSEALSLSVSAGPFTSWQVQGRAGFQSTRSTDGFGVIPEVTPALEAAFPDRFLRDANGRLTVIDQRPLNFASSTIEALTSGMNLNIPAGSGRAGSWQVGLNHTWTLTSVGSLRADLPTLDRLQGDGGGAPRHQTTVQVNGRYGKVGVNASARWQGETRVRRDIGRDGPGDVLRDAYAAIDLKLHYLFERATAPDESARRSGGLQLELEIDNLFDARPGAVLGDGRPAPGFGRDDQDPLGRVVRITLNRRF